jgi:hypothetical protein
MKLYAVRLISTKEPVGLFFVKDVAELKYRFGIIDEVTDPYDCEYAVIKIPALGAGIVWREPVDKWKMGERNERPHPPEFIFSQSVPHLEGASVSEALEYALGDHQKPNDKSLTWLPIRDRQAEQINSKVDALYDAFEHAEAESIPDELRREMGRHRLGRMVANTGGLKSWGVKPTPADSEAQAAE